MGQFVGWFVDPVIVLFSRIVDGIAAGGAAFYRWMSGQNLEYAEDSTVGISTLITLLIFVIVQGVSIVFSENGTAYENPDGTITGVRKEVVWLYGIIGLASIGCVFGILNARKGNSRARAFDEATIRYGKWVLAIAVCFVGFVFFSGFRGQLPGQTRRPTVVYGDPEVSIKAWDYDQKPRPDVRFYIDKQDYPSGLPEAVELSVTLLNPLQKKWAIWAVNLIEIDSEGKAVTTRTLQNWAENERLTTAEVAFSGFRKRDHRYAIEVQLHPPGDKPDTDLLEKAIKDGGGLRVIDRVR